MSKADEWFVMNQARCWQTIMNEIEYKNFVTLEINKHHISNTMKSNLQVFFTFLLRALQLQKNRKKKTPSDKRMFWEVLSRVNKLVMRYTFFLFWKKRGALSHQ